MTWFDLTEARFSPVINSLNRLISPDTKVLGRVRDYLFWRMLRQMGERFVAQDPLYADNLFDEHFLNYVARPLFCQYLPQETLPTPAELAAAWGTQFAILPDRIRAQWVANAVPIAASFLSQLDDLLHQHRLFR